MEFFIFLISIVICTAEFLLIWRQNFHAPREKLAASAANTAVIVVVICSSSTKSVEQTEQEG